MQKAVFASIILILGQFMVGFYLYPSMPDRMAIHWGLGGEADGYSSKLLGLFLVPLISALFFPFMLVLPRLDPSKGIEQFRGGYDWFVFGFICFMAYINALMLVWNLGWRFDFMRFLAPALGIMFYGIGVLLGKARLNWFVGIRTPWTWSSEVVWGRTHELGAKLFKVCGVLAFMGIILEGWLAVLIIVAPIIVSGVYLVYFSYSDYQKLKK
jgi:uncharacterized membrane protein